MRTELLESQPVVGCIAHLHPTGCFLENLISGSAPQKLLPGDALAAVWHLHAMAVRVQDSSNMQHAGTAPALLDTFLHCIFCRTCGLLMPLNVQ